MTLQDIFYATEKFQRYGKEYFIVLSMMTLVGILVIRWGKKSSSEKAIKILKTISALLSSTIVLWAIIELSLERFNLSTDLPLVFCNFIALILPVYFFQRKQVFFNILYFIILAGAIQAIITPGLKLNFPHYEFIKFWTVHTGLIIFVLYEMIVFGKKPTIKGIIQSFLFVQVYMVIVIVINRGLNANYLYLNVKPGQGTLLDALGGWPWYIIWMDVILIPYFAILYLPVWVYGKIRNTG